MESEIATRWREVESMGRVGARLVNVGIALSVLGVIVLIAGLIANSPEVSGGGSASFGGVLMIGPIPIIFGTDGTALLIGVIGAVILIVISFLFFFLATKRTARQGLSTASMA